MIAPEPESAEIRVLAAVDAAFAEARQRAGDWLTCHAGCDECCRRPFAITAADARRLQAGLATLNAATQADIQSRAREARQQMSTDFPGDLSRAALTPEPEWREWFFARHAGLPCPVLDLETGQCRLYDHRPVACRLAGPLIQIGETITDPCHWCFSGVSQADIITTKIVIYDVEFSATYSHVETVIAFIL